MKELFQSLAPTIIKIFGNIAVAGQMKTIDDSAYNPATGEIAYNDTPITIERIIMMDYDQERVQSSSIRPTDRKALIASADCSVRPKTDYTLTITTTTSPDYGIEYDIKSVSFDAAEAVYTLQLRQP